MSAGIGDKKRHYNDLELEEKPRGSLSAGGIPRNEDMDELISKQDDAYFTIHRYIPASDLIHRDRSGVKLIIPKPSRFQVAKVKGGEMDTIDEKEPFLEKTNV